MQYPARSHAKPSPAPTAAKAVAHRIADSHILVIDRSANDVTLIQQNAAAEIAAGSLSTRHVAAEDFELPPTDALFDLVRGEGRHHAFDRTTVYRQRPRRHASTSSNLVVREL